MLKKTITFNDLDGKPVTEDFYFHLSKAEIAEMELSEKGGLAAHLKRVVASTEEGDGSQIIATFKDIIVRSVGKQSEDRRRFIKNQDIIDDFLQTDAYSEMFMELCTNANSATEFVKGILPAGMADELSAELGVETTADVATVTSIAPSAADSIEKKFEDPNWVPTTTDLRSMTPDQINRAWQRKASADPVTE